MGKTYLKSIAVGTVMTTAFISTAGAAETDNPFAVQGAHGEPLQLAQMAGAKSKKISVLSGKCGEGKCGSKRVRQMMDNDKDGSISRAEYVSWVTNAAISEFDKMDTNNDGDLYIEELLTVFE